MRLRALATLIAVAAVFGGTAAAADAVRTVPRCSGCPRADPAHPEPGTRAALRRLAPALGLRGDDAELQWLTTRRDQTGTSVRFAQLLDGVPVREGQVVVRLTVDGDIDWVASGAVPHLRLDSATPAIARDDAVRIARQRVPGGDLRVKPEATLVAAPRAGGRAVLAWDVTIATAAPLHDWHVLLSAADGDVLELVDGLRNEVGSGKVYDPNPVQQTGDASLRDATPTGASNLQPVTRTLSGLAADPRLVGDYADLTAPVSSCPGGYVPGAASSPTHVYTAMRDQPAFEEANAYYAITRTALLFHALGFIDVMDHATAADVHCDDVDNSSFSSVDDTLRFGDGGVDDAEDGDIVAHEYGHATLEDQVPGFAPGGDTEQGAIGEGFGDMLAVLMNIDRGSAGWQGTGSGGYRFCVGEWDATTYNWVTSGSTSGCLRWTDGRGLSPFKYAGTPTEVHYVGRYWSAAMTCVFRGLESAGASTLGARDAVLQLLLDHNARLVPTTGPAFADSAEALADADRTRFAGAHLSLIKSCVEARLPVTVNLDATAPTVTATVSPSAPSGPSGWYDGNVTVTWAVSPSQAQKDGCVATTVGEDTPGTVVACTATSSGGVTPRSVIIRRDTTPPQLAPVLTPARPAVGQPASAAPHATDATSGVAVASCDPPDTASPGTRTLQCTATDHAGHLRTVSFPYTVTDDHTPPAVAATVSPDTPDGTNGWYRRDVTVTWSVSDPDTTPAMTGCGPTTLDQDNSGVLLVCTATSGGGTTRRSVVVRRDTTPPVLAPKLVPVDPRVGDGISIAPGATDATSGVSSQSCDFPDTSIPGARDLQCTATDQAGLTATTTAGYVVRPAVPVPVPRVRLSRPRADRVGRVAVSVRALSHLRITITATGFTGVRLASKRVEIRAGATRRLELGGKWKARSALRRALRGGAVKLKLSLRLEDAFGKLSTQSATLRVPRLR